MSRTNPQHSKENLGALLPAAGIEYEWRKVLGGREERNGNLPARLTSNPDVMASVRDIVATTFAAPAREGPAATESDADPAHGGGGGGGASTAHRFRRTAVMCSEASWKECHRQFLACYFTDVAGHAVAHILPDGGLERHPRGWSAELLARIGGATAVTGPVPGCSAPPAAPAVGGAPAPRPGGAAGNVQASTQPAAKRKKNRLQ